jgi:hypothetical protein
MSGGACQLRKKSNSDLESLRPQLRKIVGHFPGEIQFFDSPRIKSGAA